MKRTRIRIILKQGKIHTAPKATEKIAFAARILPFSEGLLSEMLVEKAKEVRGK